MKTKELYEQKKQEEMDILDKKYQTLNKETSEETYHSVITEDAEGTAVYINGYLVGVNLEPEQLTKITKEITSGKKSIQELAEELQVLVNEYKQI